MAGMSNSKQSIGQTCLSSSADLYRVDVHVQQQRIEGNQSKPMNRTNGMQAGHGGVHAHCSLRTRVHIRDTISTIALAVDSEPQISHAIACLLTSLSITT